MRLPVISLEQLAKVNPETVREYLRSHHWELLEESDICSIWINGESTIMLPHKPALPGYSCLLLDVIEALARYAGQSVQDLFNNAIAPELRTMAQIPLVGGGFVKVRVEDAERFALDNSDVVI